VGEAKQADESGFNITNITMSFIQSRRIFFKTCAVVLNASIIGAMAVDAAWATDAPLNKAASAAKDVAGALNALGVQNAGPGKRILLDVPEIVDEKGSVAIKVKSAIPNTDWIAVLIDKNPHPFVGEFDLMGTKTTEIEVKVQLLQTSSIVAVVRADGKYYRVDKEVKVAVSGGCE
jgi:sulfur-oxidizing protein SoxY